MQQFLNQDTQPAPKKGWETPAIFSEGFTIKNTPSSTAGAGSGEFHQYRYGRRKEISRLKQMEMERKKVSIYNQFYF